MRLQYRLRVAVRVVVVLGALYVARLWYTQGDLTHGREQARHAHSPPRIALVLAPTIAPEAPARPTPAPATPAPATLAPPTPAPATPAPATPAPPTPAPPTPAPPPCMKRRLARYRGRCEELRHDPPPPPPPPPHSPGAGKYGGLYARASLERLSDAELQRVVQNLVVDDRHALLYCSIPKAGCTTWKHYLLQNLNISYDPNEPENIIHNERRAAERGLPFLKTFNRSEIMRRLDSYVKLLVVRHPLDRLVSAFSEKFRSHKRYYQEHAGVRIIKQFRRDPSPHALTHGDDVTFEEFIKYVVDQQKRVDFVDFHWENYEKLCFPCAVCYELIAKLETNARDSAFVIDHYLDGVHYDKRPVKNQNRNLTVGEWATGKHLKLYSNLTDSLYRELLSIYKEDMTMFGYTAHRGEKTVAKCIGGEDCC